MSEALPFATGFCYCGESIDVGTPEEAVDFLLDETNKGCCRELVGKAILYHLNKEKGK